MSVVDIAEFAEKFTNVKLLDWQKEHIRVLYENYSNNDIRIVMPRHAGRSHQMYVYVKSKELIANGTPHDSKY